MEKYPFIPYHPRNYSPLDMQIRAEDYYELMNSRRSIREFSDRPVPKELIETLIKTASTAPSGANKQPWTFCLIGNPDLKKQIREAAEKEEYESYNSRMPPEWLEDLAPLGTDWRKPFLETAPWLVVIFKRSFEWVNDKKKKNYYVNESVGLAAGFFLAAAQNAGLCTLTHTPSPMDFLTRLLDRPDNERPILLIPLGYPADEVLVPDIQRKELDDVMIVFE